MGAVHLSLPSVVMSGPAAGVPQGVPLALLEVRDLHVSFPTVLGRERHMEVTDLEQSQWDP